MESILFYCSPVFSATEIIVLTVLYLYIMIQSQVQPNFVLLTFILSHLLYNWWCVIKVNCFVKARDQSSYLDDSYCIQIVPDYDTPNYKTRCDKCNIVKPPRCHHCLLCDQCIDVRDHHCYFLGTCIGKQNRSYFIIFCFYAAMGCLIASYHFIVHFKDLLTTTDLSNSWLYYLFPYNVIAYFSHSVDGYIVFLSAVIYLAITTGVGVLILFVWQIFLISQDLTSYEAHKITIQTVSNANIFSNIRHYLGHYWLLRFLLPMDYSKHQAYARKVRAMLKLA